MFNFKALKAKTPSSAEVDRERTEAEAQLRATRERVRELEARHDERLLDGTADELDRIERDVQLARREERRLERGLEQLEQRWNEAHAAERARARDEARRALEAEADELRRWLERTYGEAARTIVDGLLSLEAFRRRNQAFASEYGGEPVKDPEKAVFEASDSAAYAALTRRVVLPIPGRSDCYWSGPDGGEPRGGEA